jgi:invasion protein IalB
MLIWRKIVRIALAVVSLALLASTAPAIAQTAPQTQQKPAVKGYNPDEVICEKEDETGSRLSTHKICHTRAQWAELRQDDRSATEHAQSQRAMDGGH